MRFGTVRSRLLFWIAGTAGVVFAAASAYSFLVSRSFVVRDASRIAVRTAESGARQVEQVLASVEEGTRLLAEVLAHTSVSKHELERVIRGFVEGNSKLYGSAAAIAPEGGRRYAPYFFRQNGETKRADLASDSYRYWERDWYVAAASSGKAQWSEPYFDEAGGNVWMVTYSVPVFRDEDRERKLLGVVTADLALRWLQEFVRSVDPEGAAYATVLSGEGRILAHPDPGLLFSRESVHDRERREARPETRAIVEMMLRGEEGFVRFRDLHLGREARAAFRPVGGAGWSYAAIYPEDEILADVHRLARAQSFILAGGLAGLMLLIAILAGRLARPLAELSASAGEIAAGRLDSPLPNIRSRDELGALNHAFHRMRDSLQTYVRDLEETTRARQRIESELELARRIQVDMLPAASAGGKPGDRFELHAILEPARQIGGDLYEYFQRDGRLTFVVGDVSGKGVGAALFMARAKTLFRAIALLEPDLAAVLSAVNRNLCQENEQGMFVTLFAGVLELASGNLSYASAGHDAPVVLGAPGEPPRFLPVSGGPILGVIEASPFTAQSTTLPRGAGLVLYTDGVSEALDPNGEFFTAARLLENLARIPERSAAGVARAVYDDVKAFAATAPQSDDITVLAVRYTS